MKISFIVTVYNTKIEWIQRCISSILSQTRRDFEIILIDDGSLYEVADFCDNVFNEFIGGGGGKCAVLHQTNQGVSAARNLGVENARAPYVAFIDADDWIEPDYLETLEPILDTGEFDLICYGHCDHKENLVVKHLFQNKTFIQYGEREKKNIILSLLNDPENMKNYPMFFGAQWKMVYSKKSLDENQVRNVPGLSKSEDMVFNLYAIENAGKIGYLNKVLYHYFINPCSACNKYTTDISYYPILLNSINQYIVKYQKSQEIIDAYFNFSMVCFFSCCKLYFFHPDNHEKHLSRKTQFIQIINSSEVQYILCNINANKLTLFKKLQLFFMRHKSYEAIWLLYQLKKCIRK